MSIEVGYDGGGPGSLGGTWWFGYFLVMQSEAWFTSMEESVRSLRRQQALQTRTYQILLQGLEEPTGRLLPSQTVSFSHVHGQIFWTFLLVPSAT